MNSAMARKRQFEEKVEEDERIVKRQRSFYTNVFDTIMETAGLTIRKEIEVEDKEDKRKGGIPGGWGMRQHCF